MSPTVPVAIAAVFLIFCIPACPQCTPANAGLSANELLLRTVDMELKAQADDHSHWMYQVKAEGSGKDQVRLVVQTNEGDLERLLSVNGKPITPEQEKREDRRIESLVHKPDEQRKKQRAQEEDARRTAHLFKMLPNAVTASYGERKGELTEILFGPNPNFHPSSHEASVFHAMEGRIWINSRESRLAEIDGHLIEDVKFGGGLLGHLDKGGEFHVKQSEVASDHWEVTLLHINMHGKVLFFKTIEVQQNEVRTNFQRVPDNLTLSQAAEKLHRQPTVKSVGYGGSRDSYATGKDDVHAIQTSLKN